ncbi:MAG: sugar transferase, partial [Acidimicrobiia bacterium]
TAGAWAHAWVSRRWIGLFWVAALVLEMLTRRAWRYKIGHLRGEEHLSLRTVVVGTDGDAVRVAHAITDPGTGFEAIGFVAASDPFIQPVDGLPVVGRLKDLATTIRTYEIECLFVASTGLTEGDVSQVLQIARRHSVEVRVSSNLSEVLTSRVRVQTIGDITALSLRPVQLTGPRGVLKRAFDIVLASALLVLLSPLLVILGIAVRLTSRGPALFRQQRTTKDGRVFTMYKFRTMGHTPDLRLGEVIDTSVPFFKLDDDPRLTRVGRFLRRTSLDELPQLLNVIKGDLSLVGPRPLPVEQLHANRELLSPRLEVRAGVTGWWQIKGRSDVTPDQALRMDSFYIENWSLTLDLYILAKTVGVVMGRKGAR